MKFHIKAYLVKSWFFLLLKAQRQIFFFHKVVSHFFICCFDSPVNLLLSFSFKNDFNFYKTSSVIAVFILGEDLYLGSLVNSSIRSIFWISDKSLPNSISFFSYSFIYFLIVSLATPVNRCISLWDKLSLTWYRILLFLIFI